VAKPSDGGTGVRCAGGEGKLHSSEYKFKFLNFLQLDHIKRRVNKPGVVGESTGGETSSSSTSLTGDISYKMNLKKSQLLFVG